MRMGGTFNALSTVLASQAIFFLSQRIYLFALFIIHFSPLILYHLPYVTT